MRVSASVRALRAVVCLGFLTLVIVCIAWTSAIAQSCSSINGPLQVIYAGDNTVAHGTCFNTNASELACPANPLTVHIYFGQTVDFFQPNAQTLDAHTTTSGTCCSSQDGNFRIPNAGTLFSNTMTSATNYCVHFDRSSNPSFGNAMGHGTYNFYCEPHGNMMEGVLIVDPDSTSVNLAPSSPNPSVVGQTVNFTATVTNTSGTGITPPDASTVTFYDGVTAISSALPLSSGTRNFSTSFSSSGSHNITAVYNPDANGDFASSTSNIVVQNVQDFSIGINNPAGSALPCPGGPTCPAGESYDYTGTLTPIDGYAGSATISCQGSTPSSCVLVSPANPVAMNTPFTVRASNTVAASTFNFSIQANSFSGFAVSHSGAVSLNVGNFSFSAPNPTSVSVPQGNPSTPIALQVVSQGSFSGEVDLSCVSPPAGVTCLFSNGSATHALSVGQGATVNDTLVLNTAASVTVGAHPVTVQAAPAASPSQFQQQTVTLNENTGAGPAAVTLVYFGPVANQGWPNGPTFQYLPTLVGVGAPYSFKVTVVDYSNYNNTGGCTGTGACDNSTGVQLLITFSEPMAADSAVESFPGGNGDTCVTQSSIAILCNLNTITYVGSFYREVTVNVVPPFGRKANVTASVSTTDPNPGYPNCNVTYANSTCTVIETSTQTRPRPMVLPGQKPGNTNPK
jgi:large repetitive protein